MVAGSQFSPLHLPQSPKLMLNAAGNPIFPIFPSLATLLAAFNQGGQHMKFKFDAPNQESQPTPDADVLLLLFLLCGDFPGGCHFAGCI